MASTQHSTGTGSFWRQMGPNDHVCHLYDDEAGLIDTLTGFVGDGLWSAQSVIVLASDAHLRQLEARLRETGLDIGYFRLNDRYVAVPAEVALARFMVDDWPDELRFVKAMNELLQRARGEGCAVRAFGEMVNVLWARRLYAATLHLEQLWNKLLEIEQIPLLCAYPHASFRLAPADVVAKIRSTHTRYVPA